jgi:hypothetical protein
MAIIAKKFIYFFAAENLSIIFHLIKNFNSKVID